MAVSAQENTERRSIFLLFAVLLTPSTVILLGIIFAVLVQNGGNLRDVFLLLAITGATASASLAAALKYLDK